MKIRSEVENLFLKEMAEEDSMFILSEDTVDDIIPSNNEGLFGDSSSNNGLEDLVDDEEDNIF